MYQTSFETDLFRGGRVPARQVPYRQQQVLSMSQIFMYMSRIRVCLKLQFFPTLFCYFFAKKVLFCQGDLCYNGHRQILFWWVRFNIPEALFRFGPFKLSEPQRWSPFLINPLLKSLCCCQSKNERLFFRRSKIKYFREDIFLDVEICRCQSRYLLLQPVVVVVINDCCCQTTISNFSIRNKSNAKNKMDEIRTKKFT